MHNPAGHDDDRTRLVFSRVALVAILGLLVWPLPAMAGFSNPAEAQVLGRYTAQYAAFLAAYVAVVLVWAGLTVWGVLALKVEGFARLRRWIGQRPVVVTAAWLAAALALLAVRVVTLVPIKAFPASFHDAIVILPGALLVGLAVLAGLLADDALRTALDRAIRRILTPLARRRRGRAADDSDEAAGAEAAETVLAWAGMAVLGIVLLASVLPRAFWDYPLGVDAGMHVYVGQHVLRGGVPFRTVIVEYGPMRYALSVLWSLGARLTGLPVVIFGRGADAAVSLGIVLATYGMGRQVTGRPLGGLLAASIVVGSELLFSLLLGGPLFRLTTTLLLALSVLAGQRSRWFWAGLLAGVATMLYTPMLLLDLALLIAALAQAETPRWRALGRVVVGGGLVAVVTLAGLTAFGLTGDAYRLVVASVFSGLSGRYVTPGAGSSLARVMRRLPWYGTVLGWIFRGDWELIALVVAGLLAGLLPGRFRETFRRPQTVVPFLTALLLVVSLVADEGVESDIIVRLVPLAPFGAWAIVGGLAALGRGAQKLRYLQVGQLAMAALAVMAISLADGGDHQRYLHSLVNIPLSQQQQMADELAAALPPGTTVLSTMNFWYQTLAGQDNALPIRRFGAKTAVLEETGWTSERMLEVLSANPPAVVMWLGDLPAEARDWLQAEYDYMGYLDPDGQFFEQMIYVRKGDDAVASVVAGWPLTPGKP